MLDEIKKQPSHIRAIFMWLSVFIVFSLIIFVWIQSFQQKLSFLLNPSKNSEITQQESPLETIGESFKDLRATIFDLFGLVAGLKEENEIRDNLKVRVENKVEPKLLPLSEDKSND